ncbi:MAG: amidohydrolase family protein [Methanomassiliicoccales archaeon]
MLIDGHTHVWRRKMLPSSLLRAYLEPLLALDGIAFDMKMDREQDWPMSQVDTEWLLRSMKDAGVDRSVVLPLDFGMVEEPEIGVEGYNDWVFECCRSEKELIPFIGVDPARGKQAAALVRKYVKHCDAKGVKVYPPTGYFPFEERISYFWDLVEENELIVVTHAGASWGPLDESYSHPQHFASVLDKHPDMILVIAHLGGKFREETYELAKRYPNVYADISALQGWLPSQPEVCISRLQEAVARMPGRIIFGSDWPLFDMAYPYSFWVRFLKEEPWADESTKSQVLGGTLARLLHL